SVKAHPRATPAAEPTAGAGPRNRPPAANPPFDPRGGGVNVLGQPQTVPGHAPPQTLSPPRRTHYGRRAARRLLQYLMDMSPVRQQLDDPDDQTCDHHDGTYNDKR